MVPEQSESEYRSALELLRRKQFEQAAVIFKRLSVSHLAARAYLGWLVERGLGCTKDNSQARDLYQSAAEGGSRIAQFFLGYMYWRQGNGTECLKWFERAAAQGYAPAEYCLNRVYRSGKITTRNRTKARWHLDRSAAQGHLYALRDVQYYSLLGEYGLWALLRAPFLTLPAIIEVIRTLVHAPDDPRVAR